MSPAGSKIMDRGLSEAEVRLVRAFRERAADTCDKLGDQVFAVELNRGNKGIGILAQRHYMTCAAHIRDLSLTGEVPSDGAGTAMVTILTDLVTGIRDMRRRNVIDEENDGQWLEAKLAEAERALALAGKF